LQSLEGTRPVLAVSHVHSVFSATPVGKSDNREPRKRPRPRHIIKILRDLGNLRLAARRDHADALNDLAAALASGTGTNVDRAQAAELFQRAAQRGHSRAAANLANLANPQ
jgi:TPR repeat protein